MKPRVFLNDQQRRELLAMVMDGAKQQRVAKIFNVTQGVVSKICSEALRKRDAWIGKKELIIQPLITGREFTRHHANIIERKQPQQTFSNYGMITCINCGKLTSVDNMCHEQILIVHQQITASVNAGNRLK